MVTIYQVLQEGTDYDSHVAYHYDSYVVATFTDEVMAEVVAQKLDWEAYLEERDNGYWYNIRVSVVPLYAYASEEEAMGLNPRYNYQPEEE